PAKPCTVIPTANTPSIAATPGQSFFLFFFQAEAGIRDGHVTGVQTCALPISFPETVKLVTVVAPAFSVPFTSSFVEGELVPTPKIGRASCRERVEISVGVVDVK